jgi:hypothetical protein
MVGLLHYLGKLLPPGPEREPDFWELDHTTQCVIWGAQYERDELRKADEARIERAIYEHLEKKYADQLDAKETVSANTRKQYTAACKRLVKFCEEASEPDVLNIRISPMPARPGIVAEWLHVELLRGASANTIRRYAAAISFFHRFNEEADPCDDRLVRAIVLASTRGQRVPESDEH